jgi:outer membrane immunogenic protein
MKKLMLVTASLVALGAASQAVAADMAARPYTKAPPMMQAAYDWSGFYIGVNGGGGTSRNSWDLVGGLPQGNHDATGGTIGGQVGYRWQTGPIVFGVEAQGNWADFSGDNVSQLFLANRNRTKIDAFGLFTGQVGYSWQNVLLYVKGGAAVTDNRYSISTAGGALLASTDETRWGGTVGVGLEYGFTPNWSFGVEYDHLFMGSSTNNFATLPVLQSNNIKQDVDLFTARVNYKFGGPMVARY